MYRASPRSVCSKRALGQGQGQADADCCYDDGTGEDTVETTYLAAAAGPSDTLPLYVAAAAARLRDLERETHRRRLRAAAGRVGLARARPDRSCGASEPRIPCSPNTCEPGNYAPPPLPSANSASLSFDLRADTAAAPLTTEHAAAAGDGKMLIHHFRRRPSVGSIGRSAMPDHCITDEQMSSRTGSRALVLRICRFDKRLYRPRVAISHSHLHLLLVVDYPIARAQLLTSSCQFRLSRSSGEPWTAFLREKMQSGGLGPTQLQSFSDKFGKDG